MICYLYQEPAYFFFTSDLPELLYYTHVPATILALLVGLFVFFNGRKLLLNQLLLVISLSFSLWTLSSLISWTNIHSDFLLFVWTFFGVLSSFIAIFSIYFIYVFIEKKDAPVWMKTTFLVLLTPVLLFAPTYASLSGFSITDCDAFGFEGLLFKLYYTSLGLIAMIWILILLILGYRSANKDFKTQILLMGIGVEFFLFSFCTSVFIATYLTGIGIFEDSRFEMYGLFGMTVFMTLIGIQIVKFKTFNLGLLASQALIVALIILIGSLFTFIHNITGIILILITLLLTAIIGIVLIKGVKKEVIQREQIEQLASGLEQANDQLKMLDKMKSEFVSIASHQLRSPLTSIRGYSSMLIEGSFGPLPVKAKEAIERIHESSRFMASSVEDYLNVSRIQAGNMKYEYSDFNLKEVAMHTADDTRQIALKKGLLLTFKSDLTKQGIVHADIGKTRQVIDNLINNSLKYTPKGSINVLVRDDVKLKKIYVEISDTGIGMAPHTLENIFGKFERASNANEVNVTGTGLGLYIARKMAREMGGDVTAFSEGENKGSTFRIELPLMM